MMQPPRVLAISTLSPVHVGCDEVYEPSNFVIHEGLLHALDVAELAASLTNDERKELINRADLREPVGALQQFFRNHAARFAGFSRHQVDVAAAIVRDYEQKAGVAQQRGSGGTATYNTFPIARTAFNPFDDTAYLPGSSLKGSLRTAWLNHLNRGRPLARTATGDRRNANRQLQESLLGYSARELHKDPLRGVRIADALPDADDVPPTRVLYAVSKKKRLPRDGQRPPQEIKTFLETVPECLPAVFHGELRLAGEIRWQALCAACNDFYRPQLDAELSHPVLGGQLDTAWKRLIDALLADEIDALIAAQQGFLLRVGRHSGAESVTLDGLRSIKILGPRVDGKQTSEYRSQTTEKRFASQNRAATGGLLPFGWIWVDACDDAHRHLSDRLRARLAAYSQPQRDAQRERLLRNEELARQREQQRAEARRQQEIAAAQEQARRDAHAARQAELDALTPNRRRVEEFCTEFAARAGQLRGGRERQNGDYHGRARKLAQDALQGADWSAEERRQAADAIACWLPQVVEKIDKDQLKKLKLATLRGQ